MTIQELQKKIIEAYTIENLNKISLVLINLYKSQQYSILQKIAEIINDSLIIEIGNDGKGFSKLMMLYHPDKAIFHTNEINRLTELNDFDGLLNYSHILKLERIEEIANSLDSFEDIDYSPVYEWDLNTEGFSTIYDTDKKNNYKTSKKFCSFYDAIKLREYGTTDVEFPPYYLEDFEAFELSYSDINDLDGIQFCIHAKEIDLSNNHITDLSLLTSLTDLSDLDISNNEIGYLDALSYLINLKSLNVSNNFIDDISPLYELEKLEYVNLSGNKISVMQLNKLIDLGVTVDS